MFVHEVKLRELVVFVRQNRDDLVGTPFPKGSIELPKRGFEHLKDSALEDLGRQLAKVAVRAGLLREAAVLSLGYLDATTLVDRIWDISGGVSETRFGVRAYVSVNDVTIYNSFQEKLKQLSKSLQ